MESKTFQHLLTLGKNLWCEQKIWKSMNHEDELIKKAFMGASKPFIQGFGALVCAPATKVEIGKTFWNFRQSKFAEF